MTETLQTLIEQLHHPDKSERSHAALHLGKLDDAGALDALLGALPSEPDLNVREDMTWALVRKREAALQPLMSMLRDPNPAARHHAAHVLGKIADSRALDALIQNLNDDDPTVLAKVAFSLGQIGDVRVIPHLIVLLGHDNREVQLTLINVLEHFGAASVDPLIAAMAHEHWQTREHAADILGLIGDRTALPVLMDALQDESWQVRFAAVTALGHMGGAKAKVALQSVQTDPDPRVRELAPKVLRRIRASG